ncbi:aspartate/glutamate racemase family protein [Nocardioides maradonensis]
MRSLVVNPNTTGSMTALIGACAGAAVSGPGVTVDAVSPARGPVSIESHRDEVLAAVGVVTTIEAAEAAGYDGFVIACFGDPGLLASREVANGPVVGIAEAAMRTAGYLGRSFSVVTTLARTVGHAWDIARQYGVADLCAGIHACEIAVLDVATDPTARARILQVCKQAFLDDGSDVIVLGCAGMADLCSEMSVELGVPVIDGVAAATAEVEKLVRLGLRTSKHGELAPPPRKEIL